jgi:lysophospholipase L1-like esterase
MTTSSPPATWGLLLRVVGKAALLFVLLNLIFAAITPLDALGAISLYNVVLPGRPRLPYGEQPAQSYNLSLYNLPAMMASQTLARPKAADEFRVILIGDSATWGWFLENKDTLAGRINAGKYVTTDGRRVVAYNLGYPIMSLTKDLVLLDAAMRYRPDMIVWLVTLESFPREKQLVHPLLQNNPARVRALIKTYQLDLDPNDPRFVQPNLLGRTIVGQRRALADLIRLQLYGVSWAATGIDQAIPTEIPRNQSDFDEDLKWQTFAQPSPLMKDDLAFDVLVAGVKRAGNVPVLFVNEPMFISQGKNSQLRYNSFYPRWAYDTYRDLLGEMATANGWRYLDLWDSIAPDEFTNTPVHLTPKGSEQLAESVMAAAPKVVHP